MPFFIPPVVDDMQRGDPESMDLSDRLFRYYSPQQTGLAVWKYRADLPFVDIERASNVVTISFASPHGLAVGTVITVAEPADTSFNGTFTITAIPSAFLIRYSQTGANVFVGTPGTISFWRESLYPYQGGNAYRTFDDGILINETFDNPEISLANALKSYLGGHNNPITVADATELLAIKNPAYHKGLRLDVIDESFNKPDGPLVNTFGPDLYWDRIVQTSPPDATVVSNQFNLTANNVNTDNLFIMYPNMSGPDVSGSLVINEMSSTAPTIVQAAVGPAMRVSIIKDDPSGHDIVNAYSCEIWLVGPTTFLFIAKYKLFGAPAGTPGAKITILDTDSVTTASMSYPVTMNFTADGPNISGSCGPLSVSAVDGEFKDGLVTCGFSGDATNGVLVVRVDNFHVEVI